MASWSKRVMKVVSQHYEELRQACIDVQPGAREIDDLYHDAILVVAKETKNEWSDEEIAERVVYRYRMLLFRRTQESKRIVYADNQATGKTEENV